MADVKLHRIRIVLKMRKPALLHPFHAPTIYALLCEANARGFNIKPAIPDGLMLDAPEQCRTDLRSGDEYAFGFALLTGSEQEANARVSAVISWSAFCRRKRAQSFKAGWKFFCPKGSGSDFWQRSEKRRRTDSDAD